MFMMAAILTGSWFCVCRSESDLSPLFATQPLTVPRFRGQRSFRVVQISNQIAGKELPQPLKPFPSVDFFLSIQVPAMPIFSWLPKIGIRGGVIYGVVIQETMV